MAAIVPVTLYSVGYAVAKMLGANDFAYYDIVPWVIIGAISLIYPVNKIGLGMLFAPMEWMLRRNLWMDFNKNIEGAFGPIEEDG